MSKEERKCVAEAKKQEKALLKEQKKKEAEQARLTDPSKMTTAMLKEKLKEANVPFAAGARKDILRKQYEDYLSNGGGEEARRDDERVRIDP